MQSLFWFYLQFGGFFTVPLFLLLSTWLPPETAFELGMDARRPTTDVISSSTSKPRPHKAPAVAAKDMPSSSDVAAVSLERRNQGTSVSWPTQALLTNGEALQKKFRGKHMLGINGVLLNDLIPVYK